MKNFKVFLLAAMSLLLIRCGGKDENAPVNPAFTAYISSFTSGIVSNSDVISIRFTSEIPEETRKSLKASDLFDFSPDISGQLFWQDGNTVEFKPDKILKSGKTYEAEFALKKVMNVPSDLEEFEFSFQVIQQAVFAEIRGIEPYDVNDFRLQQLRGQVQTADYAPAEIIEVMFTAIQAGQKKSITWSHSENGRVHEFVIDSVARKEKRTTIELSWDNDQLDVKEGDEKLTYEIPSLSEFMVMDISTRQEPEQSIEISFSDPLKPNQNLNGLIYLSSGIEVRLVTNGNMVTVYPQQNLSGDHELVIESFILNTLNYELLEGKRQNVSFTSQKPSVRMLGNGVIIPHGNGIVLPFKAVNLTSVDVRIVKVYENNIAQFLQTNNFDGNSQLMRVGRLEYKGSVDLKSDKPINYNTWNNFNLDLSEYIKTEPGAIYRVILSFRPSQSVYACENKLKDPVYDPTGLEDPEFAAYDNASDYYYYRDYYYQYVEGYDWEETENPCHISYYTNGNNVVARNVLASDIGIIAKGGNEKDLHVFVTDLKTSSPMRGVELDIYNFQQQIIAKATTNGDGMATIDLKKQVPFLLIARSDDQRGYLRLDEGTSRSVSMFNVGGTKVENGLKGFIYGERGVWRPGDSLYLSFVLEDGLSLLPKGHPVIMELYTPENKLYSKNVQVRNVNGFYDFRTATHDQAPTGNWLAKVKVGGAEFSKGLKIESIKPNRLKIYLDFGTKVLQHNSNVSGELMAAWLHGATASNLEAKIEMNVTQTKTSFKEYPGYYFDDPSKEFSSEEEVVFEGSLDGSGKTTIHPDISVSDAAPGMLNVRFVTRVFERGGDFSIDRYDIAYSPFNSYVGLKIPEGKSWGGALLSDETTTVPIVTVDQTGNPVSRKGLLVEIYEVDWGWWWEESNNNDLNRFVSNKSRYLVTSSTINTVNGKATYEMKFEKRQYGRRLMVVTDPVSGHSTGQIFYLTYRWWDDPSSTGPGGAEMLTFTTDKKEYEVGETVKIKMPAFSEGRALITLEDGSKVIDKYWVTPSEMTSGIEFKTTADMAPNIFVNITLIQPHRRKSNNLPMRLYGIEKIKVVDKSTVLNPVISMSDQLEPEKPVKISVSEKSGKAMTYTIAMVDDGLLDLTRFRTPDPWSHFFSPEALGVKTWDLYQYVLGDFNGSQNNLLAIGGDDYTNKKTGQKANRFKPVVHFLGPFKLEAGKKNSHEFMMPNYVGSVRTMVIAGHEGAYGSTDFTSKVKKPVMILPTVPRVIGPGEVFRVPVSVFSMDPSVKSVEVTMKANSNFTVDGPSTQTVTFKKEGEEMVYFRVTAKEVVGIGKIQFNATSGSHQASYDVEMDIRAANPVLIKIEDGRMDVSGSWTHNFEPFGVSGTEKAMLELTSLPPIGLEKHLSYLIHYPYGCIEQTTSSVFAQLILPELMDLNESKTQRIQSNIKAGIRRITSFQTNSGGLSYWPGESYISEWGTNYGGHFMLEAKERGYSVPASFMSSWVNCQKKLANLWRRQNVNSYEGSQSELIQSYRLYLLAKSGNPALGAMNRLRQSKPGLTATWRLAGAYAIIGKKDVARDMVRSIGYKVPVYRELSYTYGSDFRDRSMILEVMAYLDDPAVVDLMMDIAHSLSSGEWYSTQETAYALLALSKAAGVSPDSKRGIIASVTINGKKTDINSSKPLIQIPLPARRHKNTSVTVNNGSNKLLFARVYQEGVPMAGDEEPSSSSLELDVYFYDINGSPIDPSRLNQGRDFVVEVSVTNPGTWKIYKELALNQVFPSGWEIRNSRMDNLNEESEGSSEFRYQDLRDDRVYTYFDLDYNETKTFRILLNATYVGRFYLPSFVSGAMYDDNIKANSKGRWVEVTDPLVN